jgi:hypothetical protein
MKYIILKLLNNSYYNNNKHFILNIYIAKKKSGNIPNKILIVKKKDKI